MQQPRGLLTCLACLSLCLVSSALADGAKGPGNNGKEEKHCESTLNIVYDLTGEKEEPKAACVQTGGTVRVKIVGLNTFLYTVEVTGTPVSYNMGIPALFQRRVLSQEPAAPSEEEKQEVKALREKKLPGITAKRETGKPLSSFEARELFLIRLAEFQESLHKLYSSALLDDTLADRVGQSDGLSLKLIKTSCTEAVNGTFDGGWGEEEIPSRIIRSGKEYLSNAEKTFTILEAVYHTPGSDLTPLKDAFERAAAEHATYLNDMNALRDKFSSAAGTYFRVSNADFVVNVAPMFASGDAVRLSMKIKRSPRLDAKYPTGQGAEREVLLEIDVVGGIKVDFSTGVAFTSLRSRSYVTQTNAAGEAIITRRGSEDKFGVAIGSLVHVYKRGKSLHQWAGSFGIGLGNEGEVQYYVGPSVFWGKARRWVLSFGLVGGEVERLGAGLEEGDVLEGTDTNIPVEERFDIGGFVGFTFNFSGEPGK